ncbi:MAG TPA: hypothetical protein VG940_01105, partial [Gemmatimonadales bacterium]|nr:hypothetical protein [Gemmatimonadales bacterium]
MTERTKARWKAIGWTVAFFASAVGATMVFGKIIGTLIPDRRELWMVAVAEVLGFLLATVLIGRVAMKLSWAELRYREAGNGGKGFGVGLLIGGAAAALARAIAAPLGHGGWALDGGTLVQWATVVGGLGLVLLPAAFAEEVLFRGVGYVALTKEFGRVGPA